jgi:MFS family permease
VIPAVGFSLFSGHFVDQREKRSLILWCTIVYLLLSLFFVGLALPYTRQQYSVQAIVWLLYAGIFVGGALRAFFSPSSFALMGLLVPRNLYPNATTWSSASWQAGAVFGPLAGGFLLAFAGFEWSLLCVAFVEIITLIAVMRIPMQAILNTSKEPALKSLKEGLKFVFSTQIILAALSLDMFAVLFGGAIAMLPAYADKVLHCGPKGLGYLQSAMAIGAVVMSIILSSRPVRKNAGKKLFLSIAIFGVCILVFALSKNYRSFDRDGSFDEGDR